MAESSMTNNPVSLIAALENLYIKDPDGSEVTHNAILRGFIDVVRQHQADTNVGQVKQDTELASTLIRELEDLIAPNRDTDDIGEFCTHDAIYQYIEAVKRYQANYGEICVGENDLSAVLHKTFSKRNAGEILAYLNGLLDGKYPMPSELILPKRKAQHEITENERRFIAWGKYRGLNPNLEGGTDGHTPEEYWDIGAEDIKESARERNQGDISSELTFEQLSSVYCKIESGFRHFEHMMHEYMNKQKREAQSEISLMSREEFGHKMAVLLNDTMLPPGKYEETTAKLKRCIDCAYQVYSNAPKREISEDKFPDSDKGLPMSEIKVGMKLISSLGLDKRVITVTEITEKGFKYYCAPYHVRYAGTDGIVSSGEQYGINGYSLHNEIEVREDKK